MTVAKGAYAAIVIALLLIFLPSSSSLFAENHPAANSRASICILAYDTEFKKNLTAALVKDFNSKGISVTVDSATNGGKNKASDYNAVILLSGAKYGRALPKAVEYIKANNYSANIVYVFTTSTSTSPYGKALDENKIDAITSASKSKNVNALDEVKNQIMEKTMKILGK
jgi:hypothetical protein